LNQQKTLNQMIFSLIYLLLVTRNFLRGGVVSTTPNHQLGGPVEYT